MAKGKKEEERGGRGRERKREGDISSVEPVVSSGLSGNHYVKRESLLQVGFALSGKTVPEADNRHQ